MENLTYIENTTWSGNASDASLGEDFLSFIKRFLTASTEQLGSNQLELYVKSAYTCFFMKQIVKRTESFTMHYDLLVLVICVYAALGKGLDVCGLSCVWCCYMITLKLIKCNVWIGCSILDVATPFLLAYALSYFKHLAFVVNILFVYTMFHFIVAAFGQVVDSGLLMGICVICGCFGGLFSLTPNPNMSESSIILMMATLMMGIAIGSESPIDRAYVVTMFFFYCMGRKMAPLRVKKPYESS